MKEFRDNLVSLLTSSKASIDQHFNQARDKSFMTSDERLRHAERTLKACYQNAHFSLMNTKILYKQLKKILPVAAYPQKTSLSETWKVVAKLLDREMDLKDIEIINHIPEDFPDILCDQDELKEILYHLSAHAVTSMNQSSAPVRNKLLILRSQVSCHANREPEVCITVADTGPGVTADRITWLFDPGKNTASKKDREDSLNLFIAKQLVLKNDGEISVSSYERTGTTFTVQLPIQIMRTTAKTIPKEMAS